MSEPFGNLMTELFAVKHKKTGKMVSVYGVRGEKYVPRVWPEDACDIEFLVWNGAEFLWVSVKLFVPIAAVTDQYYYPGE